MALKEGEAEELDGKGGGGGVGGSVEQDVKKQE